MEWREHTSLSCDDAFDEAQRWMEEVTHKSFGGNDFRPALENGVLLCDLMNQLKPGLIRRVNRLSTPIAGLDNVSVFLKACGKLGLNESQLFHPGDLQDLSSRATLRREESKRRLKNVLITIYWLGRKAQADPYYSGPQLNLKAFEGLLGLALVKALEDNSSGSTACVRDSGFVEHWVSEREESRHLSQTHLWQDSGDSCDSVESSVPRTGSEGCGSDAEAEQVFRMEGSSQRGRGHIPAPLLRQKGGRGEDGRGCPSPLNSKDRPSSPPLSPLPPAKDFLQWACGYRSDSDSEDSDRPEPDPVADDLASRRFCTPSPAAPFNFAVPVSPAGGRVSLVSSQRGSSSPRPALTSPRSEPNSILSTTTTTTSTAALFSPHPLALTSEERAIDQELLLRALGEEGSDDDDNNDSYGGPEADPVLDDLYTRRVEQTLHQTSSNPAHDRFLPRCWTPEEEVRVRTIFLGSQRRPWYRKMLGQRPSLMQVRPGRPPQVNPGWIWSKSQTNVPCGPSPAAALVRQSSDGMTTAELRAARTTAKVSEDTKWQDDLTKWKIRRRSTNSDLRKKLQERQHSVGQMAKGDRPSPKPTEKRGQPSPSPSTPAASCSMPREGCIEFKPRVRGSLVRSYATEACFSPQDSHSFPQHQSQDQGPFLGAMPALGPTVMGEMTHSASLASHGVVATTPTIELPFSSQTQATQASFSTRSEPGHVRTDRVFTSTMTFLPSGTPHTLNHRTGPSVSDGSAWNHAASHGLKDCATPTTRTGPLNVLTDPGHQSPSEGEFQKNGCDVTEGGETPDLFRYSTRAGSWSGSASLPRGYRRSEGSARLSTVLTAKPFGSRGTRVASLPRLNSVDKYNTYQLSTEPAGPPVYIKVGTSKVRGQGLELADEEVDRSSTPVGMTHDLPKGYRPRGQSLSMVQTYCHAPCTSRVSVPPPVQVRHSDMRVSLSLKPNSRSNFGFQTHWDSTGARVKSVQPGSPAEQCQLCVGDEVLAVDGHSVAQLTYDQWKKTMSTALEAGSLAMDIRRYGNKDWASSESGHPNPTYQSRKTINLTANASVLIGRTDHHANQAADSPVFEENMALPPAQLDNMFKNESSSGRDAGPCDDPVTVTRKEYERIVLRNRKKRAEFFMQKGGSESAISDLQVPSISSSSSSNWSWDRDEERRRQQRWQEEQERLLQEQYQKNQERLESEWQRAQQEAAKEGYRKPESSNAVTNGFARPGNVPPPACTVTTETKAEPDRKQSLPRGEEHGEQSDRLAEPDWAGASYGFSQLSAADRTKSQSTPALATLHKPETRGGALKKRKGRGPVSQEERERQQILEEMRKRTQLLTDNSWIRQQSASVTKEPLYQGGTMRRYESLDDMHIPSSSLAAYQRPISAAAAASALRCSAGAGLPQRHASWSSNTLPIGRKPVGQSQPNPQQPGRAVSGKRACSVCERSLGRGAAVVIEALGLCFHPACFQCADCRRPLGDYAAGARVRIRKRKPFCEPCYLRLRVPYAPSI